jgi:hypothetical protein
MRYFEDLKIVKNQSAHLTIPAMIFLFILFTLSTHTTSILAQNATGTNNQTLINTFNSHGTISGIAADTMIGSNEQWAVTQQIYLCLEVTGVLEWKEAISQILMQT